VEIEGNCEYASVCKLTDRTNRSDILVQSIFNDETRCSILSASLQPLKTLTNIIITAYDRMIVLTPWHATTQHCQMLALG